MFELFAHAMHMKAHFTALLPEEQHQTYIQPHMNNDNPDGGLHTCTQFRHCEDNPFYPDIVQADGNEGWYSTDQSNWLGMAPNDANPSGVGQYVVDGENYGGVDPSVMGEKASG
jgi:hypothetical protein